MTEDKLVWLCCQRNGTSEEDAVWNVMKVCANFARAYSWLEQHGDPYHSPLDWRVDGEGVERWWITSRKLFR